MQTIKLRISNKVYKNIMWFLEHFNKDEIQIINQNDEFLSIQEYLLQELNEVESGKSKFISIDDLDGDLNCIISKHEA